jgi:hypothetical protein
MKKERQIKIYSTRTGLLMEGHGASLRPLFATSAPGRAFTLGCG